MARQLVLKMSVSLDGFVCGTRGETDWAFTAADDVVSTWHASLLHRAGLHLMGRTRYDEMALRWATSTEPYARLMNESPKLVFSSTLREPAWAGTRVTDGDLATTIRHLKLDAGEYLLAHGGARFAHALSRLGLVDQYQLLVHPIALGQGVPLFTGRCALELVEVQHFPEGAVALTYQPA